MSGTVRTTYYGGNRFNSQSSSQLYQQVFHKTSQLIYKQCNLVNSNITPKCWYLSTKFHAPHIRTVISPPQHAVNMRLKITGNLPWTNPLLLQSKKMLLPSCTFAICLDTGLGRLQIVLGSLSIRVPTLHQTFY